MFYGTDNCMNRNDYQGYFPYPGMAWSKGSDGCDDISCAGVPAAQQVACRNQAIKIKNYGAFKFVAAPQGLSVDLNSNGDAILYWNNQADNAQKIAVQRSINGGAFVTIKTLGPAVQSYIDTTITANKTYAYRIVAAHSTRASNPSNVDILNTSTTTAPSAPTPNPTETPVATVTASTSLFSSIPTWGWIAGGVALLLLLRKGK